MFCFDPVIDPIVSFVLCNYTQILVADRNGCNIRMVAIAWKIDKREDHNLFCEAYPSLDTFLEKKAISQAQYNKSLGDLRQLMDMQGVE